ncbi:MAG: FHA domain-containing protein [Azospirillum sp.]|nr:FHA domain-containing protein [Azospirillum sp.]
MEVELAIIFVDICDSTRLYERLGNVEATALTQGKLQELRAIVGCHAGRVVKSLGDGLMCVFPTADDCCNAAAAMLEGEASSPVRLRIGCHFGCVVEKGNDVFGDAINVTARVESLARPNEILATEDAVNRLSPGLKGRTKLLDTTVVKGKTVPIGIYRFRARETVDDSMESTVVGLNILDKIRESGLVLHLHYLGREFTVSRTQAKLTIGRDSGCDIHILSKRASRNHGAIEFERESFILRDHSSNGTFIATGESPAIPLIRDATKLVGKGLIGVGAAPAEADGTEDYVIRFWCDVG